MILGETLSPSISRARLPELSIAISAAWRLWRRAGNVVNVCAKW